MVERPYALLVLERATSTQDEVRQRMGTRPLLMVAGSQTQGRGRSGSVWDTAPRALAASLGVHPPWRSSDWPLITLVAGVAAVRSLGDRASGLALKWPNDLMKGDGKLGGILTEASGEVVVIGWGANLYWPDPPTGRKALFRRDPGSEAAVGIAEQWARELLGLLARPALAWPHDEYRARCSTIGREITWHPDGRGRVVDVSSAGGLVVSTSGGLVTLRSGAVSEVRHGG